MATEPVGDGDDIGDEVGGGVVLHPLGAGAGRVAPLVWRHGPVSRGGQRGQLRAPLVRRLREPVQQEHEAPVLGPGDASPKGHPPDRDLDDRLPRHAPASATSVTGRALGTEASVTRSDRQSARLPLDSSGLIASVSGGVRSAMSRCLSYSWEAPWNSGRRKAIRSTGAPPIQPHRVYATWKS